jgi:hypothetical protein
MVIESLTAPVLVNDKYSNHRQLLGYEKNGAESAFGTKKKHVLKSN